MQSLNSPGRIWSSEMIMLSGSACELMIPSLQLSEWVVEVEQVK